MLTVLPSVKIGILPLYKGKEIENDFIIKGAL